MRDKPAASEGRALLRVPGPRPATEAEGEQVKDRDWILALVIAGIPFAAIWITKIGG